MVTVVVCVSSKDEYQTTNVFWYKSFLFVGIFTGELRLPQKRRRQKPANNNFTCVQIIILSFRLFEAMRSKHDSEDVTPLRQF